MKGVILTPKQIINSDKGKIFHILKNNEDEYNNFGEAYFSTIKPGFIKGWKKHTLMTLNIVVCIGKIKFVIYDDRENSDTFMQFSQFILSEDNYCRLTIEPNLWFAFQSIGAQEAKLLNISNILHDPDESFNINIDSIKYFK